MHNRAQPLLTGWYNPGMRKAVKKPLKRPGMRLKDLDAEVAPVSADWRFWSYHALHWCALLACVVAFIYIGYSG